MSQTSTTTLARPTATLLGLRGCRWRSLLLIDRRPTTLLFTFKTVSFLCFLLEFRPHRLRSQRQRLRYSAFYFFPRERKGGGWKLPGARDYGVGMAARISFSVQGGVS